MKDRIEVMTSSSLDRWVVTVTVIPRSRLVPHWSLLAEGMLDEAGLEFEDRFFAHRGRPMVTLSFEATDPQSEVEAKAVEFGAMLIDKLEQARKAESAQALRRQEASQATLHQSAAALDTFIQAAKSAVGALSKLGPAVEAATVLVGLVKQMAGPT